jgi:hypothetical protein
MSLNYQKQEVLMTIRTDWIIRCSSKNDTDGINFRPSDGNNYANEWGPL